MFGGTRTGALDEMVNEGVRRAYLIDNRLRGVDRGRSRVARKNTRDNTPAVIHTEFVPATPSK